MHRDENGMGWGWDLTAEKWVKAFPIDVREMVEKGDWTYEPPETVEARRVPPGFKDTGKPPTREELVSLFGSLSKPELRDVCGRHGVPFDPVDTTQSLVAKLIQCGVTTVDALEADPVAAEQTTQVKPAASKSGTYTKPKTA